MKELLEGKKVLVAGAGGLLGSRLILKIIEQGANVIAADIDVEKTKSLLSALDLDFNSNRIEYVGLDVTCESSVKSFFANNLQIDGAVNCTYPRNKDYGSHFFDVTLDSFNENVSLHLGSAFLFTQQCAVYFKKNKTPFSLINIASVYGVVAPDFKIYENTQMTMPVEYAAIKSGLLHLNKYVVKYINDSNFRVNSVSPGGVFDSQPDKFLQAYKRKTLGKGMLEVESIAGAVLFLLSEQSKYIVGQNIVVDDGFTI